MKKFKKALAVVLTVALGACCLTACGKDDDKKSDSGSGSKTEAPKEMTGTPHDTGVIKVSVPDGWLAIDVHDMWSDDPNAIDKEQLQIAKGATSKDDLWGHCYIQINYSAPGTIMASAKSYYDNPVDIAPFEAAGYSWTGYECESMGYKYTIIEGKKGEEQLQVAVLKNAGEQTINFDDEDVQFIINSIETTIPAEEQK